MHYTVTCLITFKCKICNVIRVLFYTASTYVYASDWWACIL